MRFFLCLSICIGLLSIPSVSIASSDSGGWLSAHEMAVRPVVFSGAVEDDVGSSLGSRNWFLYQSKAGSRVDDTLEFWNKGKKEVSIVVEAADAELLDSGFALSQPGLAGKYIGKWVSFVSGRDGGARGGAVGLVDQTDEAPMVTVGAGQKKQFPFSIMVPFNAHKGDYWGGITVREIPSSESKKGANAVWRVGVRVLVRVVGSGATAWLPQAGFGGVYYPELSLFLRNFAEQMQMPPVFQALSVLFYRG